MKKLLLLGSVVAPCPPLGQGGTERVVYTQAKYLAKKGICLLLVAAKGTQENFRRQLTLDGETDIQTITANIEFIEVGGGTQLGNALDAIEINPSLTEGSRKLRLEMLNLALVEEVLIQRKDEYDLILNNMRGETVFLPLADQLGKQFISVAHLNIFPELATLYQRYNTNIITLSEAQKHEFPSLAYLETIPNPITFGLFPFNANPKGYALMLSTIGRHKNQKDAIVASQKAGMPLILAGKIRDQDYFDQEIKPYIDGEHVTYYGELDFQTKVDLYKNASCFLFPILWQEPFGLVVIESLACGTPVIAYPHGGPKEIIKDGETGFLVETPDQMAQKIGEISKINRERCRESVAKQYTEEVVGEKYYAVIKRMMNI